ncbi:hypothetical protein DL96DRAFT_1704607 [Flagelloscypha sp. PMI_526]|nr:hypothetical protein DL96DRAFT_1704607 [Flagelloscypha sp. PMI_526]
MIPARQKKKHNNDQWINNLQASQQRYQSSRQRPVNAGTLPVPILSSQFKDIPQEKYKSVLETIGVLAGWIIVWVTIRGGLGRDIANTLLHSFEEWLWWMMLRQPVEQALIESWNENQAQQNSPIPSVIHDIHESPFWQSLSWFLTSPYNLVFAVFLDWFNPFTNKIAGKTLSTGAIILYCLNFKFAICLKLQNTFLAAMMPAPNTPDVYSISHVLEFLNDIIPFFPGKTSKPFTKLLGILHRHHYPTAPSSAAQVRAQACAWKKAEFMKDKQRLARENGVCWTKFHELTYWNPVQHVVLGWMHCWLEGVLQFHLCICWGIGWTKKAWDNLKERSDDENNVGTDSNEDDLLGELFQLQQEQEDHNSQIDEPAKFSEPPLSPSESDTETESSDSDTENLPPEDENDWENQSNDSSWFEAFFSGAFTIDTMILAQIRAGIVAILLPTWVVRLPGNLGEASHGKLKADEFLILFIIIFPLILPSIWWLGSEVNMRLLQNLHYLVSCTNIVASFSTSATEAQKFTNNYIAYWHSMKTLFPYFDPVPNHHFAMHIGQEMLTYWGLLASFSEAKGEQTNGILQQFKTRKRLDDLPLTMMDKLLKCSRLEAQIHDKAAFDLYTNSLMEILELKSLDTNPLTLSSHAEALFFQQSQVISQYHYTLILDYLHSMGQNLTSYYAPPEFQTSPILPHAGNSLRNMKIDGRTFSTQQSHEPNSHIQFHLPSNNVLCTGYIEEIWAILLDRVVHHLVIV